MTFVPRPVRANSRSALLVAGILLIAGTLRAPITVVGPLIEPISNAFSLSASRAGLLTTLPLLAFALVSPLVPLVAQRLGVERALFAALIFMATGIVIRAAGTAWALYAGTCVIGGAVAVGNVLLPSLVKRDFSDQVGRMTAFYALSMITVAGMVSAVAIPLHRLLGAEWQGTLVSVLVIPLLAAVLWLPQLRGRPLPTQLAENLSQNSVWKSPLAWQVAAYLGLTCFIHFAAIAWLPTILQEGGDSDLRAGAMHGWMQLAGGIPALLLVPLLQRMRDQRRIAFVSPALSAIGLLGLMVAPSFAGLWVFAFGMGMGSALVLSFAFVGLRAGNQRVAASLSGMAQCVGYLLASVGPSFIGLVRESAVNWNTPLSVCIGLCFVMCALGLSVGRSKTIDSAAVGAGRVKDMCRQ